MVKIPLSARNRIKGVVKGIGKGEVAASVKIKISEPATITSMITEEAADDLGLKEGDNVEAVIKASEVMDGLEGLIRTNACAIAMLRPLVKRTVSDEPRA